MVFQIAVILLISLFLGLVCKKLSQPLLLGYIFTGMIFSFLFHPTTETELFLEHLGHFGLLMLIFKIGLEFDIDKFKKLWKKSALLFIIQGMFAFLVACVLQYIHAFHLSMVILLTFLIMLNSAAISVKLLEEFHQLQTQDGAFILSVLILQDLAIVPIVIILSEMSNASFSNIALKVGGSIFGLCILMKYLSDSSVQIFQSLKLIFDGNREIIILASMSFFFLFAFLSESVGLASSYGTFLAGLILGSSGMRHDVFDVISPLENLLMMIFFIYVGSLINIFYVLNNWMMVVLLSLICLFVNLFVNYLALRVLRFPKGKSFFLASILTQAAEFSFTFIAILAKNQQLNQNQVDLLNTLCVISLILGSIFPFIIKKIIKEIEKRTREKIEKEEVLDNDVSCVLIDTKKNKSVLRKVFTLQYFNKSKKDEK